MAYVIVRRRGLAAAPPTSFNLAPKGITSATPDVLTALHINAPGTVTPANAYQRSLGIDHIVTAADGTSIDYRADGSIWTPPGAGGTPQQMIAAQQAVAAQNAPPPASPVPSPAPAPSQPPSAPTSAVPAQPVQPTGFPSPVAPSTTAPAGPQPFSLSMPILGLPLWVWGAGAVGAFFLFGGGHGR